MQAEKHRRKEAEAAAKLAKLESAGQAAVIEGLRRDCKVAEAKAEKVLVLEGNLSSTASQLEAALKEIQVNLMLHVTTTASASAYRL